METLLQTDGAKNTELPLPSALSWKAVYPLETGVRSAFLILPELHVAGTKFWVNIAERWGLPPFTQSPLMGQRLYLG